MADAAPGCLLSGYDHPVFTRVYSAVARLAERGPVGRTRRKLLEGVSGRLLIVGLGPGMDLRHVPPAVTDVLAVEPSVAMLKSSLPERDALQRRGIPVRVLAATAEELPLADDSVDAVLLAFVLCSVTDVERSLASARRVLRPEGKLLLLEHVRGADGSLFQRAQRAVEPVWGTVAGRCSLLRDPGVALEAAGFDISGVTYRWMPNFPLCARHLVGTASLSSGKSQRR